MNQRVKGVEKEKLFLTMDVSMHGKSDFDLLDPLMDSKVANQIRNSWVQKVLGERWQNIGNVIGIQSLNNFFKGIPRDSFQKIDGSQPPRIDLKRHIRCMSRGLSGSLTNL